MPEIGNYLVANLLVKLQIKIIGPYYFTKTITAAKYKKVLDDYLILYGMRNIENFWFMQYGARPHRISEFFQTMEEHFQHRVVGLDADKHTGHGMEWSPYSSDPNPLDFFLWGFLKDKVFKRASYSVNDFKTSVGREIEAKTEDTLIKVIDEFENGLMHVIASSGSHFEQSNL